MSVPSKNNTSLKTREKLSNYKGGVVIGALDLVKNAMVNTPRKYQHTRIAESRPRQYNSHILKKTVPSNKCLTASLYPRVQGMDSTP